MTETPMPPGGGVELGAERRERLYYGWVVVGASVLVLAGFLGTLLSFGVFLKPLQAQFGWSRAATSGAMSLCIGVQGTVGILMGRFTDKYNMGFVVALGTLAGAVSYLLLSRIHALWQFYLCFGVGAGICSGCAFTPVTATVSKWFDEKRRTMALGIALTGVMIGQMVLSPVVSRVIGGGDWRLGYVVSAIVVLVCGIPGIAIMAKRPPLSGHASPAHRRPPDGAMSGGARSYTVREAAKTAPFWMIIITAFAISCGFYIVMSQIVAHARDLEVPARSASLILTFNGVGSLAGGLLAWWFTRRMGHQRTLLVVMLVQALAMFLFTVTASAWSLFVVITLFGLAYGTASPVRMSMIPALFGLKAIGTMLGCTTFAWSIGGLVGPYVAGYVHDATDKYTFAFIAGGILYVIGAASVFFWGSHKKEREPGTRREVGSEGLP
jgi:sugar phosphate permease